MESEAAREADEEEEEACPSIFECPITFLMMRDPTLLVQSGITFEREAIEQALSRRMVCPVTNVAIDEVPNKLAANLFVKSMIQEWLQKK
jgi:hypothetical protein